MAYVTEHPSMGQLQGGSVTQLKDDRTLVCSSFPYADLSTLALSLTSSLQTRQMTSKTTDIIGKYPRAVK